MEAKLNSPVRYRGTVATADLLPLNPDIGDMYNIESKSIYGEAGMNVAWNGVVWDTMGAPIDMSLYIKSSELADWVKQQNKPTYTAEEVGALPADTKIPSKTSDLQNDSGFLTKIPDNYLSETDKTLSVSGKAADAKATGDKITELSADISNKLNKNQGSENSGKIAGINESGDIVPMFPVSVDYNEETNCLEFGSDQKMELNKGINLDSTLTKTGYAADAGAVGEITNSLKEDISGIEEKFTSTNKGIKPLFLELSADYNWVSNNEVPIFSTSNERFADGTADGNNAYFKINGNKGDNFVTVIEGGNALISDITITGWWGAIISNDGVHYSPCNARYKDGNTIEIYPPLSENITDGELGNIKTGIHLSKRGYLGYAQKAFSLNPKWCEKGKPIAKFRVGDTDKFIKFGGLALLAPNNIENMSNEFLCRYATTFSSLDFYNSWTDHETPTGIEWETELGGKSGYLELFVGGRNASYIEYPDGYEIHIEVYINGVKSYEKIKKNQIVERICIDFEKADIGKIRIYSNKWSAINSDVYGFSFGPVTWWENEKTYKRTDCIFEKYATIAQMFDSWGVFHNSAVAKELSRLQKEDCAVYVPWENHSKGSQTSAWGKGWFYENVLKYHPQYMIIDFLINDGNSTVTSGFPATVEGSDGTVYNNLISRNEYITNMIDLCNMAIANGIQPIVFGCCLHDGIDWYHALIDAQENVTY